MIDPNNVDMYALHKILILLSNKKLSQVVIHLNDQPVGPVAPYARLGTPAEVGRHGSDRKQPLPPTTVLHTMLSPLTPGKSSCTGTCPELSGRNGPVFYPWVQGNHSFSTAVPLSCYMPGLLKSMTPGWCPALHWKREEGKGPTPDVSPYASWHCRPQPARAVGTTWSASYSCGPISISGSNHEGDPLLICQDTLQTWGGGHVRL